MKSKFCLLLAVIIAVVAIFGAMTACGASEPKLNGAELSKYTVVYAEGNHSAKTVAEKIVSSVKKYSAVELNCISDAVADSGNEIIVGNTNRRSAPQSENGKYYLTAVEDKVYLSSDTTSGIIAAGEKLISDLKAGGVDYSEQPASGTYDDLSIKAMSFNIRTTTENRWDRIENVIERNDPDILGTQEVSAHWQPKFKNELEGYTCVGSGRADAGDEAGYILYKTNKFTLDEESTGTRWYSDTPTKPSKLPTSTYTRIYTYALLTRISDNTEFLFVNTHLDLNQEARMKQMEMLTEFIEDEFAGYPVYITGDFNTDVNDTYENWVWGTLPLDEYDVDDMLMDQGYMNTRLSATQTDDHWTFPTTLYPGDADHSQDIIDYCFVKGNVLTDSYAVDAELPDDPNKITGCGDDASDHYPIIAETVLYKRLWK